MFQCVVFKVHLAVYEQSINIRKVDFQYLFTFHFFNSGSHLLSRTVSSKVPSAVQVLTIVFGMGTGVSQGRIATRKFIKLCLFITRIFSCPTKRSSSLRFLSLESVVQHILAYPDLQVNLPRYLLVCEILVDNHIDN